MRAPGDFTEPFFALMRVVIGVLFAMHGAQKLLGWFGAERMTEPLMVIAGVIELFGGLFVALGLGTRAAAFISSGLMAAAYFIAHWPRGFLPILNQGELAAVYCFVFLFIAAHGGGRFSLDAVLGGRRS